MRTKRTFLHRPACFFNFPFSSTVRRGARTRLGWVAILALGAAALLLSAANAHAATQTLTVNTLADSNDGACNSTTCSLRDAIVQANADTGDTIQFSVTGTITLTSALPAIVKSVTIEGPAAGGVTVSGGHSATVGSIFSVGSSSVTLSISGLTIANGDGSGIHNNSGTVTVTDSTFYGNSLSASPGGGGISSNGGVLTVINCTFVGNSASGSGNSGGGIYASTGTLTVANSTFYGNSASSGGGISRSGSITEGNNLFYNNSGGDVSGFTLSASDVSGQDPKLLPLGSYGGMTLTMLPLPGSPAICAGKATDVPSGVTTDQRGFALNAANCTNGGVDAGAVQAAYVKSTGSLPSSYTGPQDVDFTARTGTLTSSGITISGAVNLIGPGANKLTLTGASSKQVLSVSSGASAVIYGLTISKGKALTGGGISNAGTLAMLNSTVTTNTAGAGGGIDNSGTLTVSGSTFSGNSASSGNGGGIQNSGTLTVVNSTFSGNTANTAGSGGGGIESTGTLTATNSTFSGNSAEVGGGINVAVGSATVNNSIIADNAASITGAGLDNAATLNASNNVYFSNLDATATEDDCKNCTTNASAVTASSEPLATLGSYGGTTQTMLPLPITTSAICAGASSLAVDANGAKLTTDQRGVAFGAGGYCSSGAVDAGAVQTDYTSAQFTNDTGYSALVNQAVSPAPVLSITENGQKASGIPVTLIFTGPGTATGVGSVTTVAGTGATFNNIKVDTAGASDSLSVSLPVGTSNLTASADLEIDGAVALSPASGALAGGTVGTAYTTTLAASGGKGGYSYGVSTGSTLPAGLKLNSSTGVLSGTPTTAGSSSFSITVTDKKGNTGSAAYTLAVSQGLTAITVTSKDGSAPSGTSYVGDSVTFTASLTPVGSGVAFANGVAFTLDGSPVSTCTAQPVTVATSGGATTAAATCVLSSLSTGTHTLTASYPTGDANYSAATSAPFSQTVSLNTTSVSVIAAGASTVNASLKFTAVVTDTSGTSVPANGTVAFTSDSVAIPGCGAVALVAGSGNAQASCSTSTLTKGSHNIVATYSGDSTTFAGSSGSLSQAVNAGTSTIALVSSPNPSIALNPNGYNDQVGLTATVGPTNGVPLSGSVTFTDNGGAIPECQAAVAVNPATGVASCITSSLTFGSHTISATYSGDSNFNSSSASITQAVQDYSLAASPTSTVTVGQRLTNTTDPFTPQAISVSASPIAGFTGQLALSCNVVPVSAPTGAVPPTCILGSATLAITASAQQQPVNVTIDAGTGSNPVATPGSYNVSITGVDSTTGLTRTSAAFVVNVRYQAPPLTIVSGATTGNTSSVQFTLPPNVGITTMLCASVTGPTLTSSVAPVALGMGCTFSPSTIAAASTTQNVMVAVTVTTSGTTTAHLRNDRTTIVMAGLAGVPLLLLLGLMPGGKSSRKLLLRFMVVVFAVVMVLQGTGCGGGSFKAPPSTSGQTPPGSYNILVQGTGTDGQVYQAVIQVNVTR